MCMTGTYCRSRKFWGERVWEITDVRSSPLRPRFLYNHHQLCAAETRSLQIVSLRVRSIDNNIFSIANTNCAPVIDFKYENSGCHG